MRNLASSRLSLQCRLGESDTTRITKIKRGNVRNKITLPQQSVLRQSGSYTLNNYPSMLGELVKLRQVSVKIGALQAKIAIVEPGMRNPLFPAQSFQILRFEAEIDGGLSKTKREIFEKGTFPPALHKGESATRCRRSPQPLPGNITSSSSYTSMIFSGLG
jgi:hypothetical protein